MPKKINDINRGREGKKSSKRVYFILLFLLFATFLTVWPDLKTKLFTHAQIIPSGTAIPFSPEAPKSNLQLYWFLIPSPTPRTPAPTLQPTVPSSPPTTSNRPSGRKPLCALDDDNGINVPDTCECIDLVVVCKDGAPLTENGTPFSINDPKVVYGGPQSHLTTLCKGSPIAPGPNGRYCIAKPVVYLYPISPTFVDVRVESEGEVVVSDPLYPEGGWQDVLAFPNGTLYYEGNRYSELFFETEVSDIKKPDKGIIIKTAELDTKLGEIVSRLGLVGHEKRDFLEFWVPRLKDLNSPYIFFSLLDKSEKLRLDNLIITPQPDTVIEFIAYFKGIDNLNYDGSLQLPPAPKREGFVSVEWGGSLDK